jgi:ATP-dependent DNA helicase HFM1/MER3
LHTSESIVCSAPTGSGKTTLLDLAIVHMLLAGQFEPATRKFAEQRHVAVYMAPTKALCDERCHDWKTRFEPLGLRCLELTGDSLVVDMKSVAQADIIMTTPEKWDSTTRSWRENKAFVRAVSLFLIDEAHLLNDKPRGATLEAVGLGFLTFCFPAGT